MKLSIVTAYYNRKELLIRTLDSLKYSSQMDYEFIVVDDASEDLERIEDLVFSYPFLKVIRIEKKDKHWVNPCVPFNLAISKAVGDIIVLQNPECYHVGDVLTYIVNNVNEFNYIAMPVYALDKTFTNVLKYKGQEALQAFVKGLPQQAFQNGIGWYNHFMFRPVFYHFCAAITRNNLKKLGGFDERFAHGIAYDDNELVERVKRLGLQLSIPELDEICVIHQYHGKMHYPLRREHLELVRRNENLFKQCKKESIIKIHNSYE